MSTQLTTTAAAQTQVTQPQPQPPVQTQAQPKPQAQASTLGKFAIKKAKPKAPRVLIYGQGGVGKTTLAAKFPKPLFVSLETGLNSSELSGTDYIEPESWEQFLEILAEFKASDYRTVVIDSLDVLIAGIFNKYICKIHEKDGAKNAELIDFATIQYGKGTNTAQQVVKSMLNKLDEINNSNKTVILLAHSQVKPFNNPAGENYDTYQIKGNDKINDVVKCWCDEVYFAEFVTSVDKDGKATGGKNRWLNTENSAAYFAKSRFGLQGLSMDYTELMNAYKAQFTGGAK